LGGFDMVAAVSIMRTDLDAAGLRQAASRTSDGNAARRMLALALVLDGRSRGEAAEQCGMGRQTLRDWVHRYNTEGLAGLCDRPPPGGRPRLTPDQDVEVARLVREGPTPAVHGVVRWRRIDLSRVIKTRFGVHLAERSVGALLRRLGFRRISARPRHPSHDAAAQAAHKKTLPSWSLRRSQSAPVASRSNSGGKTKHELASRAP
jgi:transposase